MKPKNRFYRRLGLIVLTFAGLHPHSARAATFSWTPTAAGTLNWDDGVSNWTTGFPNAAGDIANLTANLAGAETINLNQAITVGALNIGDPTTGFFAYTIAPNGGSLTFNNSGAGATLSTTNVATGVTNVITSGITLADNLTANIQSTNALTISGIIGERGGARSLTKTGSSILTLSNANTYSGATTVTGGLLKLTTGTAASSAATISGFTTTANALDMSFDNSAIAAPSSLIRLASLTLTNGDNKTTFNGLRVTGATTNTANNSADTITGALTVTGAAGINVAQTGTTGVGNVVFTQSGGAGTTTLNVGSISRGTGAVLNLTGTGTFGTTTFLKSGNTANLGGLGAGGTAAAFTQNIVPWVVNSNNGFYTYDATNGFVLAATTGTITAGSTTLTNVKQSGGSAGITLDTTVNSYNNTSSTSTIAITAGKTLTINSGAMNFAQPTIITGGTLQLGATGVATEGVFNQNGRNVAITSVITGTGGLTLTRVQGGTNAGGSVAFAFGAANTYSGVTTLTGGDGGSTLIVGDTNALQNTTLNALGGGVSFGTTAANQATLGNKDITTANFGGLAGTSGIVLANSGSAGGAVALTVGSDNDSTLYSGVLSGTGGSLTKTGTGTLTLSASNTYTGNTAVLNGTVALGTFSNVSTNGTLGNSANSVTLGGSGTTGTLQYTGVAAAPGSSRPYTLASSGSGAFQIDNSASKMTLTGLVDGSGGLIKTGAGALELNNASNSYSGGTAIKAGAIQVSQAAGLGTNSVQIGDTSGSTAATLTSGSAITVANNITVAGGTYSGTATLESTLGSGTTIYGGNVTLNKDLSVNKTGNGSMTLSGTFEGVGNVSVSNGGSGIVNLTGATNANNWTGNLIITLGAVRPGSSIQLTANNTVSIDSDASLNMGSTTSGFAFAGLNDVAGATGGVLTGGSANGLNNTIGGGGAYVSSSTISTRARLTVGLTGGGSQTLSGNQSFNSEGQANGLTVNSGLLTLSGTNSYLGATVLNSSSNGTVLSIQSNGAVTGNAITVNSGTTLKLQGGITTTNSSALTLKGTGAAGTANTGTGALENVSGTNTYSGLVTLGAAAKITSDADTLNLTHTGTITGSGFGLTLAGAGNGSLSGIIGTGSGTLEKTGNGKWTLSGANTYTGATLVSGGTLALDATGTIDNTSGVSLGTGGTFDVAAKSGYTLAALTGSGNVLGALTVSTTLAIGNSPGTATFSNDLTIGSGATSTFEFTNIGFTGGSYDLAQGGVGTQNVTFGGGILNLLFSGGSYVENSTVRIFDFETYSGNFGTVNFSGLDVGQSADFDSSTGYVTITAVPEPNAAMLVGGLGVLALLRRRRH